MRRRAVSLLLAVLLALIVPTGLSAQTTVLYENHFVTFLITPNPETIGGTVVNNFYTHAGGTLRRYLVECSINIAPPGMDANNVGTVTLATIESGLRVEQVNLACPANGDLGPPPEIAHLGGVAYAQSSVGQTIFETDQEIALSLSFTASLGEFVVPGLDAHVRISSIDDPSASPTVMPTTAPTTTPTSNPGETLISRGIYESYMLVPVLAYAEDTTELRRVACSGAGQATIQFLAQTARTSIALDCANNESAYTTGAFEVMHETSIGASQATIEIWAVELPATCTMRRVHADTLVRVPAYTQVGIQIVFGSLRYDDSLDLPRYPAIAHGLSNQTGAAVDYPITQVVYVDGALGGSFTQFDALITCSGATTPPPPTPTPEETPSPTPISIYTQCLDLTSGSAYDANDFPGFTYVYGYLSPDTYQIGMLVDGYNTGTQGWAHIIQGGWFNLASTPWWAAGVRKFSIHRYSWNHARDWQNWGTTVICRSATTATATSGAPTATRTPTATSAATSAATSTAPPTGSPTRTPTRTATRTAIAITPTATRTPTATHTPTITPYPSPPAQCNAFGVFPGIPFQRSVSTSALIYTQNGRALAGGTEGNYIVTSAGILWPEATQNVAFSVLEISDNSAHLRLVVCDAGAPATATLPPTATRTPTAILPPGSLSPGTAISICLPPATLPPDERGPVPTLALGLPTWAPLPTLVTATVVISASGVITNAQLIMSAVIAPAQTLAAWSGDTFGPDPWQRAGDDTAPIVVALSNAFGWLALFAVLGPLSYVLPPVIITLLVRLVRAILSVVKYVKQIIPFN